jgi:hypothetical protein
MRLAATASDTSSEIDTKNAGEIRTQSRLPLADNLSTFHGRLGGA